MASTNAASAEALQALAMDAWKASYKQEVQKGPEQALFGRVNLRINIAQALKAVYYTAKVYIKTKTAVITGPWEIAEIAKDAFSIVVAALNAVRETMSKLSYTACVVLSAAGPQGYTEAELEAALKAFVAELDWKELPWYMGFTQAMVDDVRKDLANPGAFKSLLKSLEDDEWFERSGDRLIFKARHYTSGFTLD